MLLKLNPIICFAMLFVVLNSCSGLVGPVDEKGFIDVKPKIVRTYVGQSFKLNYDLLKSPSNASLNVSWVTEPEGILEIDEYENFHVIGTGKADVVAQVFDKDKNLVNSDTVAVYSEAKKILEVEGSFDFLSSLTAINWGSNELIVVERRNNFPYTNSMYYSADLGESWTKKTSLDSNLDIYGFARSEMNTQYLSLIYLDRRIGGLDAHGIMVSKDGGDTWSTVKHPFSPKSGEEFYNMYDISFSRKDLQTIYAHVIVEIQVSGRPSERVVRLYKSSDLGSSWSEIMTFDNYAGHFLQDPLSPQIIYSHTEYNGANSSIDGGSTWELTMWPDGMKLGDISETGKLYGLNGYRNGHPTISTSSDYGESWDEIHDQDYRSGYVDISVYDEDIFAVVDSEKKIWVSIDGGMNMFKTGSDKTRWEPSEFPVSIHIVGVSDEFVDIICVYENEIWRVKAYEELYVTESK